jgi:hypothetical protein
VLDRLSGEALVIDPSSPADAAGGEVHASQPEEEALPVCVHSDLTDADSGQVCVCWPELLHVAVA